MESAFPQQQRQKPSLLLLLAILSLFTFAGGRERTLLWVTLRLMGCGAAIAAASQYRSDRLLEQSAQDNTSLLEALKEVQQGYQFQLQNLQVRQHQQVQRYNQHFGEQLAYYKNLVAQLEQKLEGAQNFSFEQFETYRDQLAIERDRLHKERDAIAHERSLLDEHYAQQQQTLEALQESLDERQRAIEQEYRQQLDLANQQLEFREAQLNERERAMLEAFEAEWNKREEFYAQIAQAAINESQSLKQPDYPLGHSHEELLACEAIRCLYEHGIVVKNPVVRGLKGGRFELRFKILPVLVDGRITTPVRSLGEAFKRIERELIKPLRIAVRGCCADPTIEPVDEGLRLLFDVSGTDWDAIEQERKVQAEAITDPLPVHLSFFIQNNPQISLMGDSGEGKTTLINNLVALMEEEFRSTAHLIIINPKPNEETDLTKLRYADFESCIFGLLEAATEILYRLRLNTAALLKRKEVPNNPLPSFDPVIYFFDEFSELAGVWNRCKPEIMEEVLDEFEAILSESAPEKLKTMSFIRKRVSPSSFAADLLKFCWRVGRTEKVKLLIAGQNLKAGTIGTNVQDLHQTAIIYLGEAIKEGLDNRINSWQKESLSQEYAFRSRKVAEGKANRFYGLFVPKGSKAYFATLPTEGAYIQIDSQLEQDEPGDGPAPPAPPPSDLVQELERLWHLPLEERTEDESTRTPPVPEQYDPLHPEMPRDLIDRVLAVWDAYNSQTKTIEIVWGVSKSGTSKPYRAAKWKFRRILHKNGRTLPGKAWGEDPDDSMRSSNELDLWVGGYESVCPGWRCATALDPC